jgi:DNA polymerase
VDQLNEIIGETIKTLEEMKRSGVTHVEVSRATLEELGKLPEGADTLAEMKDIEKRAKACVKCKELSRCRHNVVFGVGNVHAELMFIGEAPGHNEDVQGEPFVGRAGELLTKIIVAMGFQRSDVYTGEPRAAAG